MMIMDAGDIHKIIVDRRHAPDHGFDGAPLDGAAGNFVRGELCVR
jgi:hypothetical protein